MIGTRLPPHVLAAHALESGERVLQRVVERVADMQAARYVGRRDDDAEIVGALFRAGAEGARVFPLSVEAGFDLFGVEILV